MSAIGRLRWWWVETEIHRAILLAAALVIIAVASCGKSDRIVDHASPTAPRVDPCVADTVSIVVRDTVWLPCRCKHPHKCP